MPHVSISMWPGRDEEVKARLAEKVRVCVADELGLDRGKVSVSITDVEQSRWPDHIAQVPAVDMICPPGA